MKAIETIEFRGKRIDNQEWVYGYVDAQSEREMYRIKCKHYLPENEQCCLKSGWHGSVHLLIGCDGDCRRMKNYDKKHANNE